jgi:CheY-like chemotaxis protein
MSTPPTTLAIFLVEDEALLRMLTTEMIQELGNRIVAEAGSIEEGRPFAETAEFDLALLHANLAGHSIMAIAEIRERRRLPIRFVSGYTATSRSEPFDKRPLLHKTFQIEQLKHAIEGALKSR